MVIVFSAGRSGTNLVLEILSGSSILQPSLYPEDKMLFQRDVIYPPDYLTKCDSVYVPCYGLIMKLLEKNRHAKIVWTIRHPYDWVMSKIRRGYGHADDATLKGCFCDMYWAAYLYCETNKEYPGRVLTVKMEDIINDIEGETRRMCSYLKIPFEAPMLEPWRRMRHKGKRERYPSGLDKSQLNMYKDWKSAYDGFLTTIDFNMEDLFTKIKPLLKTYNYEE